jgi:DNA repair protein RecN (Recombination protein N)
LLSHLSIKNYALIDSLDVSFASGFTCITGETGAGKSILLGALSLVLGKRADLGALQDKDQKCIVEAEFLVKKYGLELFFKENDLDYDDLTIIRREILPSGKSRAFINDTPITLDVLSQLGNRLIDVHSQHQTLQLGNNDFQMKVIDALAGNKTLLTAYSEGLEVYKKTLRELNELVEFQSIADKEHDYNSFLLKELQEAPLKIGLQEELENQYEQLNNMENIIEQLSKGDQLLNDEQVGILNLLTELKQVSNRLSNFGVAYVDLNQRIQSVFIEIDDIASELLSLQEDAEANPELLETINGKLQTLYDLQKKHGVNDISELITVRDDLDEKVSIAENMEANIEKKEAELRAQEENLDKKALEIHERRTKVIAELKKKLETSLASLGMGNATFKIVVDLTSTFKANGKNDLTFLFSANKGTDFGDLKKVASGGELSRIMLTIKSILAQYEQLPTMMFDEIDTGVSGDISNRMGDIMQAMSQTMQVFSITHLPQVASKGNHHFKVFKVDEGNVTRTRMKQLSDEARVVELAEMLGGKDVSDSALAHARQLLN